MQETQVRSLGLKDPGSLEDPLEKETATHSNVLAWKIPWMEEPGGAIVHGITESDTTEQLTHTYIYLTKCPTPTFTTFL